MHRYGVGLSVGSIVSWQIAIACPEDKFENLADLDTIHPYLFCRFLNNRDRIQFQMWNELPLLSNWMAWHSKLIYVPVVSHNIVVIEQFS